MPGICFLKCHMPGISQVYVGRVEKRLWYAWCIQCMFYLRIGYACHMTMPEISSGSSAYVWHNLPSTILANWYVIQDNTRFFWIMYPFASIVYCRLHHRCERSGPTCDWYGHMTGINQVKPILKNKFQVYTKYIDKKKRICRV